MLAFVNFDDHVPPDHALRTVIQVADDVLSRMFVDFDSMYSRVGRASVPPERLLKSLLVVSPGSIRSERAFCQELDYNVLYRWFLDMDLMEPRFNATVTTENRRRVLRHKVGRTLFEEVAHKADRRGLMSGEYFSVENMLIEAAESIKSFRRRTAKCCDYGVPQFSDEDVEVDSRHGRRGAACQTSVCVMNGGDQDRHGPRIASTGRPMRPAIP